ncbi:hypothetical protein G443_001506 [Actinoalloteichus cyanogriseus DSM 43889]|uniref:Uncharacterized protein n=1 Tax=Actinoalloteichus caeruleus DSM 43889 TaxID=1120930 RepID=A0ABT1JFH5_ACTCY|nr:hypothetical protein [Actinoalloteichus caeruleus DSM 43889]
MTRRSPGDHQPGALPQQPAALPDRVQPAGLLPAEHPAGPAHPVPDGDLPGGGRVEPGDRLVDAHPVRAVLVQALHLPLAELDAARGAGGDDGHLVLGEPRRVDVGVGERLLGGGETEVGPPVGLRDEPVGNPRPALELRDRAGVADRVHRGVEPGDRPDAAPTGQHRVPVVGGGGSGRGDHAEPGDDPGVPGGGGGACRAAHPVSSASDGGGRLSPAPGQPGPASTGTRPGLARSIALWKPPNPLPTLRTASIRCSLATRGT